MTDENQNQDESIIRDKRRIDPETGEVRKPKADGADAESAPEAGATAAAASASPDADAAGEPDADAPAEGEDELTVEDILSAAQAEVDDPSAEHLADLKRVTAEYANYRKRTEANRELERERAMGAAVAVLLPVLDDLDRAEKHGDLESEGAFATIAAKLRASVERLGLAKFGEVGEAFDPQRHEAIFQQHSDEVEVDTVADVVETGYLLGDTLLRVAKVVVKTPA
ncbi:nucleotide exchange factor GrpE [Agromyces marinus]|uniref:nucleotide exchange factor GrpE n=1 Tax=Agromyces marinus TaxID=1389020 RepID=UPI001F4405E6|nr:nucleotide exchange factor GrpE [Agromyces marinus]UIP59959.1 Protein GrpE [Agromyces marinus]